MAADAVLVFQGEDVVLGQVEKTLVKLAPMQPGRSYVVWAKGQLFSRNSHSTLRLEAFDDAKDSVEISFSDNQCLTSFALMVATTLPPDDDLFTVAKITGTSRPFVGGPETGTAIVKNATLVVLAVDSIRVQQG